MVGDATVYAYPDQDSAFYFFNPVPGELFAQIIDRIDRLVVNSRVLILIVRPVSDLYPGILREREYKVITVVEHHYSRSLIYSS